MILKLMIAGVVLYYLVLFFRFRKEANSSSSESPGNRKNEKAVVGKTTFRLRQVTPYEDTESQFSKGVDNASIFAPDDTEDTPQPMDVEFEMKYEDELEAEEIALITGGEGQSARGISFEEMAQAVQVVREQEAPEEEERKALQTLSVMQQTSLYDTMMEQINGGMVRVAEMLGKYDAVFIAPPNEASPEDLQAFDMNDYM
ncbi:MULTISPECIES: hypothetical protein [Bacteroidota]|jgi:hypothetical protein|uniref:Conjugative transposon protein TraD n=1 Tax=Capnocytophaga cynodegmi TaxID=28189 RepID=A0A0B7HN53_9FLAO|nr:MULTISPECIES: hypothetical protein [Bacteroidota]MBB3894373.1 hypothetical protein [Bacteroides pyogenes]CEN38933.1 Conjugative transposon protein TraD [Capnocytophaga cynodegmi]